MGDFNDILESGEKVGGNERSEENMLVFREFVDQGALLDSGYACYVEDDFEREEVLQIEKDLSLPWAEKEVYLQTKARNQHLKAGEKNTKFFHASTMIRRRQNTVREMENSDGVWEEGLGEVECIVEDYFKKIFMVNDVCMPDRILSDVSTRVTSEMNHRLTRTNTSEEVTVAVFEMPAEKSPRPDGMTVHFFQSYFHIISDDIIHAVDRFFLFVLSVEKS
ncbi:hypothetical protein LIER_38795 [Lithospermum erythrorhizon]|uniref:Uncharacterized protein n=1 Tax=Lithospermum erythrorhizon TaxID=34254 RepID=A0AAV3Q4T7_LITER